MKILYAIQGTGNGHLSRAKDIVPILKKKGEVDILISGVQTDVLIPFDIKYNLKGMSFIFGKKGGIDLWDTWKNTSLPHFWKEIKALPITNYDLVINDFEAVSAWAARLSKVRCVALSHQTAVINDNAPKPEKIDWVGNYILNNYAPANHKYGFHFQPYDKNIFTPVIRQQIRNQEVKNNGHYTVYLPAYGDKKLIKKLSRFDWIKWEVFSKHSKKAYREKNVFIRPIHNEIFIKSIATSEGILCGAGFETPAEALYLEKKLMVIPMKSQYEQQCNAAALKKMGIPTIKNLKEKRLHKIEDWLNSNEHIKVNYPNYTEEIIDTVLSVHPLIELEEEVEINISNLPEKFSERFNEWQKE